MQYREGSQDLSYHPVGADADQIVGSGQFRRLLLVGYDMPATFDAAGESRYLSEPEAPLPTGVYEFELDDGPCVMVVTEGSPPGHPAHESWDAADDAPLIQAFGWFSSWWEQAHLVPEPKHHLKDDVVTVPSGQDAVVRDRRFNDGHWSYKIRVDGRLTTVLESSLASPVRDEDPHEWVRRSPALVSRFASTLTRVKLREQLTDTVYSFRATRTIFRPYQFRPVIKLLETGHLRLLIADEVGLGKTIEAGLIWTELDARSQASRVLVVCPSGLVAKWRAEMQERFGFDMDELTSESLSEMLERLESDRLPSRFHAVCSLERLRIWGGLERMTELAPRFDLVIVDEAHALRNMGTRSFALGTQLSDWADALVFLSATPLNLGNRDLYNLLELLAPGEFDDPAVLQQQLEPNAVLNRVGASLFDHDVDNSERLAWLDEIHGLTFGPAVVQRPEFSALEKLMSKEFLDPAEIVEAKQLISELHALSAVVTRTRKVEIQEAKAVREARRVDVDQTEVERELYNAIERWQRARADAKDMPVAFIGQMPLRLASSCLPAARDKILARDNAVWRVGDMDASDPIEPEDFPPLEVVELAKQLGDIDSKFDAFIDPLTAIVDQGRQVLVFTFSRDALAYLKKRLSVHFRVDELHGGVKQSDRAEVMQRFRAKKFDVLLASRVASEGLDFEFCSAVVNYDLPWNPMEIEQRIGRIDRFGQPEEKVIILNFHTPGTIESDIIERVHSRIGVFNDSIGELEPILQSRMSELREAMFDFSLNHEQRQRRIDETLSAIEAQAKEREKVETASAYLSSTDKAEIDGLEDRLVNQGRYVGQPELVWLLTDWLAGDPNARIKLSPDGKWLYLRGTQSLEKDLMGVQTAGERYAAELNSFSTALRDERDIAICLDQETARTSMAQLLTANHPLVRAALRVPGYGQARFASVRLRTDHVAPGRYFVLLALAKWSGVRSSAEFWTAAESLDGGADESGAGESLLAALADARIEEGVAEVPSDLERYLRRVERQLENRLFQEQDRRMAENRALARAREISLKETYALKIAQIDRRIATIREGRAPGHQPKPGRDVIVMHEAQRANQDRNLREALSRLEATREGAMDVEYVAACVVEVLG